MSNLAPPLAQPVQRLGSRYRPYEPWPKERPRVISPADVVETAYGTAESLFNLQPDMLHGLNLNDPAKWRMRCQSVFGGPCLGSSWLAGLFRRS